MGKRGDNIRGPDRPLTGVSPPDPAFANMTPDEVADRIDAYFDSLWSTRTFTTVPRGGGEPVSWEEEFQKPPTMAGLGLALGCSRITLWRYQRGADDDDPLKLILTRAVQRIAEFAEEALYTREGSTGARFALEVNHRYGREEDEEAAGGRFTQNVIPPAPPDQRKAIPKFEEG